MRRLPLLLIALLLTGCQARTVVEVQAASDGKGEVVVEVRLDEEAAAAVPDLQSRLRTDDLKRSGWSVEPVSKEGNETVVRISQPFEGEAQANAVLAQMGADASPFSGLRLTQERSLTGVETTFVGTIDLTRGIESFGDESLRQRFGRPLGVDAGSVAAAAGIDWAEAAPVTVRLDAPGSSAGPTEWTGIYGERTPIDGRVEGANLRSLATALVAAAALLGALVILFLAPSGKYVPKHSAKSGGVRARDLLASGS